MSADANIFGTDADRLRSLLSRAGLSQRAAARRLDVPLRRMRRWCAGSGGPVPEMVFLALHKLADDKYHQEMSDAHPR